MSDREAHDGEGRAPDVSLVVDMRASTAERARGVRGDSMPYEPSAPCAACARGVDPLRAACVSVCENSVHYFCSRSCRETYLRSEREHEQTLQQATRALAPSTRSEPLAAAPRRASHEPVARRIALGNPSTPVWPLIGCALSVMAALAPVREGAAVAGLGLAGSAIVFAAHTGRTRAEGGLLAWLSAPVAVGMLVLSALLRADLEPRGVASLSWLAAACGGVILMWLREHLLERAAAVRAALHSELAARLSHRVRTVVSDQPPSEPSKLTARSELRSRSREDRAVESLCVGHRILCEAGSVIPVDGVVLDGAAEVLPYPNARLPIDRAPGDTVLGGALVVEGSLHLRATRTGDERALFRAFDRDLDPSSSDSDAMSVGERAESLQAALFAVGALLLLALLGSQPYSAKLACVAAALLVLPALALAGGIRGAFRAAIIGAAARGVRYRDPATIERAGRVDTAVLRVEGVLVPRAYTLIEICSLSELHDAAALLALALAASSASKATPSGASAEVDEPHAIALAVRAYAASLETEPVPLRRLTLARGLGVSALTDGQGALVFGSRAALLSAGVSVAVADREAQRAESSGQRVVFLALGGRVRGLFVFGQAVRNEARVAAQTLFDLGIEVELVSGDHHTTVDAIARTLDVTQVRAELSAEQRAAEVRRLREGDARVVALGRAPADEAMLTSAELSVCLDAAGQPHRREAGQAVTYDITTASTDLRDAAHALLLARRTRRLLQWIYAASAAAGLLALLAAGGVLPPLGAVLAAGTLELFCLGAEPTLTNRRGRPLAQREDA